MFVLPPKVYQVSAFLLSSSSIDIIADALIVPGWRLRLIGISPLWI